MVNQSIGLLAGFTLLLLWWPLSMKDFTVSSNAPKNYHHILVSLLSEISTAPNFNSAFSTTVGMNFEEWSIANPINAKALSHVRQLSLTRGVSATPLVELLLAQERDSLTSANTWREKSAAARTASMMLILLPVGLWLMARAIEVDAVGWLFTSNWGRLCLLAGIFLTVFSRMVLALLNRKYLQHRQMFRSQRAPREIPLVDPNFAAIILMFTVVFFVPTVVGLVAAVGVFISMRETWPKLQSSRHLAANKSVLEQRPWVATVIAVSLQSGLSWLDGVRNACECSEGAMKVELERSAQRLQWGIDPAVAFSSAHAFLQPISETIARSSQTGAPIHASLMMQAKLWNETLQTQKIQGVEVAAERMIVPVALLQLPAFILVGVVPMVAAEVFPMLETFSSTSSPIS